MRFLMPMILLTSCLFAGEMPSGQGSAEGAATDLQKALLFNYSQLYRQVQNPKLLKNKELASAVMLREREMDIEKHKVIGAIATKPGEDGVIRPAVLAVSRMGAISAPSAIETARKEYRFKEIGFVDVTVRRSSTNPELAELHGLRRTFVVQDEDGKWYALDRPDLLPALTQGWRDEKPTGEAVWSAPPEPPKPSPVKDPKEPKEKEPKR